MPESPGTIREVLADIRGSLDHIDTELKRLDRRDVWNRAMIIALSVIIVMVVGMYVLGYIAARDARDNVAENLERAQVAICEDSSEGRDRLRGLIIAIIQQAEAGPQYIELVNEALPPRDCAAEAEARREAR